MAKQAKNKKRSKTPGKRSGSSKRPLKLKVSLERTGGFSGIRLLTLLDGKNLSSDERAELLDLIEEADFFGLPGEISAEKPAPDRFQYTLRILHGNREHSVKVDEAKMPSSLRPLVQYLKRHLLLRQI